MARNIFLAPRSNETSYKNFISSMKGRPRDDIWQYLTETERDRFGNQEKFFIWGCQPSLENRWLKMDFGDYILFYAHGKFIAVGELQFKKKSRDLAESLWPVSTETQEPWSCVFFVNNLQNVSLPIEDFSEMTGYKMDRVQGFMRVSTGLPGIVRRYGGTENFIQALKSGLNWDEVGELANISEKPLKQLNFEDQERLDELTRNKSQEELEEALKIYAKNALNRTPEQVTRQVKSYKRNQQLVSDIKAKYKNKCQICAFTFKTARGNYYSEAAHIIPISKGIEGVDSPDNIWVLCANHHRMLDTRAIQAKSKNEYIENGHIKKLLYI
jgi:5-methylcytosine-specific restriction endonuclease McrA